MTEPAFDFEEMLRASERQVADAGELERRTADMLGRAESSDGRVKVAWSAENEFAELAIDPRALREGSEKLAETIMNVTRTAKQDLQRQVKELTEELFGASGNPMEVQPDPAELQETIEGVRDLFSGGLRDANRLLEQMRKAFER